MNSIFTRKNLVLGALLGTAIVAALACPLSIFAYGASPAADSSDGLVTPFTKSGANFRLSGSTTIYPIMVAALANGAATANETLAVSGPFQNANAGLYSGLAADISVLGSSHAPEDLAPGYTDLGEMSRMFKSSDAAGLTADAIARDGIAMIVNSSVTGVSDISKADIVKIYNAYSSSGVINNAGSITNWSGVTNSTYSGSIVVVARDAASGTYSSFKDLTGINGTYEAATVAAEGPNGGSRALTAQDVMSLVASTPNSIGYVGIGDTTGHPASVKVLTVAGKAPTAQNVTTGTYLFSRYLWLVRNTSSGNITPANQLAATDIVNWMKTLPGQNIVEAQGFVRLSPRADVNGDGVVDIGDVSKIGLAWGKSVAAGTITAGAVADVNQDGVVDIGDVSKIGLWWGVAITAPTQKVSDGTTNAAVYPAS